MPSEKFLPAGNADNLRNKLYNEFYKGTQLNGEKNAELYRRNPTKYIVLALAYVEENFRLRSAGCLIERTVPVESVVRTQLSEDFDARLSPEAYRMKALVSIGDAWAYLRKAGANLFDVMNLLVQPLTEPKSTDFDKREFKGQVAINAFEYWFDKAIPKGIVLVRVGVMKLESQESTAMGRIGKILSGSVLNEFGRNAAYLYYITEAKEVLLTHKLKPNEMYSYERLRQYAHESMIPIEEFNEALIKVEEKKIAFPHLIFDLERAAAPYAIMAHEGWLTARKVVAKSVKGLDGLLEKPLPEANVSFVTTDQVEPHASWIEHVAKKMKQLPETLKELDEEVERILKENPGLVPQKA